MSGSVEANGSRSVIEAVGVSSGYGDIPVLRDLNLHVRMGEVVALLGANGAGKTTTLLTLVGELRPSAGEVRLLGEAVTGPLHERVRLGLGFIPERAIIPSLTTLDNLRLGPGPVDAALAMFPELERLVKRRAGLLSGGEQQMLTLARAMAAGPKVLLADEVSLGLAPLIVRRILDAMRTAARERGVGVLLVEQQIRNALHYADRAYVLRRGQIVMEGSAADLSNRVEEIEASYLTSVAGEATT